MEVSTILGALGIIVGLVALLALVVWVDVIRRGHRPPEPTGTVPIPPPELGPRWTPDS